MNTDSEVFYDFGVRREFIAARQAGTQPATATNAGAGAGAGVGAGGEGATTTATGDTAAPPPPPAAPPVPATLESLPFQLHVRFTKLDGMECLRVITRSQPVTSDVRKATQRMNVGMYAAHAAQTTSRFAEKYVWREYVRRVMRYCHVHWYIHMCVYLTHIHSHTHTHTHTHALTHSHTHTHLIGVTIKSLAHMR